VKVASSYPTTLYIDGEPLRLRVKKLTREQWIDFSAEMERSGRLLRGRELLLKDRQPGEDGLTSEQVEAKRFMALSLHEREAQLEAEKAEELRAAAFTDASISAYVTAEADALYDEEAGRYVTDGADIVRLFGQRPDVLAEILTAVLLENRLSAEQKKTLQVLRASQRGSSGRAVAPGTTPDSTAAPAESEASAASADATGSPETSPSGATAPSS